MEIRRIAPLSLAIIFAVTGTVLAAFGTLLALFGIKFFGNQVEVDLAALGPLLLQPLLSGLASGLSAFLFAVCYNLIASLFGGIVIELEKKDDVREYKKEKFEKLPEKIEIRE